MGAKWGQYKPNMKHMKKHLFTHVTHVLPRDVGHASYFTYRMIMYDQGTRWKRDLKTK